MATAAHPTDVDWRRVDALVDAAPGLHALRTHGLQLFAARRWRALGRPVPGDLPQEELQAAWRVQAAPAVLEALCNGCDGPVLLFKGPAVAAHYPDPSTRPFVDIDVLVPDAPAAQASLLAAGFEVIGDPAAFPDFIHHLPPLQLPGKAIAIEVHSRLKWVDGLPQPSFDALAATADRDVLGVDGLLGLPPAEHALVLAGHLWAHDPLARLLRILDVAVMAQACEPRALQALARSWGMERLWRTTTTVADALFAAQGGDAWPLRTWARGLRTAREPTVSELHLSRLLSPFAIYPPAARARALAAAIGGFARPHDGEPWRRKVARTAGQLARPSMRRSEQVSRLWGGRGKDGID